MATLPDQQALIKRRHTQVRGKVRVNLRADGRVSPTFTTLPQERERSVLGHWFLTLNKELKVRNSWSNDYEININYASCNWPTQTQAQEYLITFL